MTRLFGRQAAAPIVEAYLKLEEHEEYLGWRGQGNFPQWGDPREITIMKRRFRTQLNPYDGPHFDGWDDFVKDCRKRHQIFGGSLEMLREALAKLLEASPRVRTAARRELDYLVNKTEAYMLHFELVRLLEEGYISYDEAFQIKARNREAAFRDRLVRCQDLFQAAHRKAREVAEKEAEFIDHPSDVAILFELNSEVLTATEECAKFIKNVVNFHHGLPYWEEVRWHRWSTRYTNEIIKLDSGRGLAQVAQVRPANLSSIQERPLAANPLNFAVRSANAEVGRSSNFALRLRTLRGSALRCLPPFILQYACGVRNVGASGSESHQPGSSQAGSTTS